MKVKTKELFFKYLFLMCAVFGVVAVGVIIFYLFSIGMPAIFEIGVLKFIFGRVWAPAQGIYGILPMIVGSLYVTAISVLIGVTIGLFAAIFLSKYCRGHLQKVLRQIVNLLAGIPSVVYGFFGLKVLIPFFAGLTGTGGAGLMVSSIILAIMILPTVVLISFNSLNSVPDSYYEGALALGATHTQAVFKTVLPAAKNGIFAGVILGVNRAIGETMAIVMVSGNIPVFPKSLFEGMRTLTGNIVLEMGYATGEWRAALVATGVVLFIFVLIIIMAFNYYKSAGDKPSKRDKKITITHTARPKQFTPAVKRTRLSSFLVFMSFMSVIVAVAALLFVIGFVMVQGIPHITADFLFGSHTWGGSPKMLPSFVTTLMVIFLSIIIAVPIGVCASIYLSEYTQKGSRLVKLIRTSVEALAGIPSIIFGLFGMLFFVVALKLGASIYAGAFTMVLMILPIIIRTTEESLKSVPDSYREGSFALGAGKFRTIVKVVLPSALSGIITSIILAMGRIIGESAPLLYTVGSTGVMPSGFNSTGMTLAVFMYILSGEGHYVNEGYAVGVVLIFTVILLNLLATGAESFFSRKKSRKE